MLLEKVGNEAYHPCLGYNLEYDCWVVFNASISGLNDATCGVRYESSALSFSEGCILVFNFMNLYLLSILELN